MPGDFDLVKERTDIVQLVGERVALRKAGRAYKGLCPFHAEKTPSFTVDPDRRSYKCFGCLPPSSLVKTVTGMRPIEEIEVGDLVYASDGRPHRVLVTHEHQFSGELVSVSCAQFKVPLVLTPNHEVPVLRPKSRRPVILEAGALRPQNYLLYPSIQREGRPIDWSAQVNWFGSRGREPKALPDSVNTSLFAEWLGWYLAEGSVSQDRTIHFSLCADEVQVFERLNSLSGILFGEELRHDIDGNKLEAWFCHALLSRWLKYHCGQGAKSKSLPEFVWTWPAKDQWTLFHSLMRGDGSISRARPVPRFGYFAQETWCLTLSSATLIDDVRDLAIANGVVPQLRELRFKDARRAWSLTVSAADQERWGSGERPVGDAIPLRIRKVRRVPYDGPVHNLTVEDDHTYVTMTATVCNCGEGGDVFDWLIKTDGVDKAEALKILAERAGVELTGGRPPAEREREKRLLAAHETAHFYFRQALRGTPK
ncbi:MAG: CHC2 zinc finger domain-containing protein, partial [Actinomycetota bacterium]|nr:CHC2 zinc finger domain-containing protein [Actinomycetota bacterium]